MANVFCQTNVEEFSYVGQDCNYSSLKLGVEREDLLQQFDSQWVFLIFLKWMMSHGSKMPDFHGHQSGVQGFKGHKVLSLLIPFSSSLSLDLSLSRSVGWCLPPLHDCLWICATRGIVFLKETRSSWEVCFRNAWVTNFSNSDYNSLIGIERGGDCG